MYLEVAALSLLLLLLGDGLGDPGLLDEVEQVLVATWSAHGSAVLALIASCGAEIHELLDLVDECDEDPLSPGMLRFDTLEGKLGILG